MNRSNRLVAALIMLSMSALAACGGGGGGGGGNPIPSTPAPTPTPTPTPTPPVGSTLVCRSSGAPQSIGKSTTPDYVLRKMPITTGSSQNEFAPGVVEVVYRASVLAAHRSEAAQLIQRAGGNIRGEIDASATGDRIQIVSVQPGKEDDAIRQLQASDLVKSASRSAVRRLFSTTAAFPNDPFFNGFSPNTTPPLYQGTGTGGQWDTHAICAANAWGYGNTNSTGVTHPGALGGTVRVAIIDTGADLTHPELATRVVFQETVLQGVVTTTGMHDNDGHGTNVAGIAAATANNGVGFAGVAYAAPLMIFKVFPDPPPGGCAPGSTSNTCTASGADVATAIRDAVTNGARVINLSLGASTPDPAEESAVAAAIAAGVVVVAASGNEGAANLDYPAADSGVIAVGASSIDDTNPNLIGESVASYSNYSAANPTWGVVAPGGDPCPGTSGGSTCNDQDDLHWIENIYTSTAADSTQACRVDPNSTNGIADCRILFAGTSQATPHVTGAVALLLSVNPALTPATVKTTLCSTARNISNSKQGCGRVDVYRAMASAVGDPSP